MNRTFYDALTRRLGPETVASFQRRAGLSPCALANYAKGGSPSRTALYKIAKALGEPVEKWAAIAKASRDTAIRPGRKRRNRSYLDYWD